MGIAKCEICEKVFENKRPAQSLVLHMEKAHGMRKTKNGYVPIADIDKPRQGQWRLLDPNDEIEKMCMDDGCIEIKEMAGVPKLEWELR